MKKPTLITAIIILTAICAVLAYTIISQNSVKEINPTEITTENAKHTVKSFFEEGYVKHNYDFVMNCVSPDYIDHSPAQARSNADAVGILKIVRDQFPDLKITILDIFAEKDMVATRILFEGTHSGACQGIEATGKRICFEALENFKVIDGKIVESWGYWPDDEIRRQLTGN